MRTMMCKLLVLLGMIGMSDAYAGGNIAGRLAAARAARIALTKRTAAISVAALLHQQATSAKLSAKLLAKDEDTAMPDHRPRRDKKNSTSPDRVERGDTVGSSRRSSSHDSWSKSSSVFDERNTGQRRGNAP